MASSASPPPPSADGYRGYRAPREDNRALIEPAWGKLVPLAETNRRSVQENSHDAFGWRVNEWSAAARRRMVELARGYTSSFCDPGTVAGGAADAGPFEGPPLFVAGHQPDLFHPGVWVKNRVLDQLAKRSGGVGVHLLIDSDQRRGTGVRAPRGPVENPSWDTVPFDRAAEPLPHEERSIIDADGFGSFAQRASGALAGLVDRPLVGAMWGDAVAAAGRGANLGEALSQARRLVEQRWGASTLELPLGRLWDTPELRWAVAMLIVEAPRVREAYNAALADYRVAHRLRTPAQPLPDLSMEGSAVEAPLWVWTTDNPTRRPLFVERTPGGCRLVDRSGGGWSIEHRSDASLSTIVDQLATLRAAGVKVRPRALATTLFSRLLLGDLFLHGIGGAKYDQVTDGWSRRWLGFAPPPHATVTATLRLPIDYPRVDADDETRLRVRMRELLYHPERFIPEDNAEAAPLIAGKRSAIHRQGEDRAERHRAIVDANRSLYRFVAAERQETAARIEEARQRTHAAAVLGSREYSFCLFPEEDLRERMEALLR